ncbi:hypothetical protein BGZ63DRAFT_396351 [Mariannaea sp. PMI_226]|nr:hypothetical protein BGZ63DRAFT_396351 [Mariannaea sp. PMI_226]
MAVTEVENFSRIMSKQLSHSRFPLLLFFHLSCRSFTSHYRNALQLNEQTEGAGHCFQHRFSTRKSSQL